MKVKIKIGSMVGQDFSFFKWEDDSIIFDVDESWKHDARRKLTAYGYGEFGSGKSYGCGAIFVSNKDIITISIDDVMDSIKKELYSILSVLKKDNYDASNSSGL